MHPTKRSALALAVALPPNYGSPKTKSEFIEKLVLGTYLHIFICMEQADCRLATAVRKRPRNQSLFALFAAYCVYYHVYVLIPWIHTSCAWPDAVSMRVRTVRINYVLMN